MNRGTPSMWGRFLNWVKRDVNPWGRPDGENNMNIVYIGIVVGGAIYYVWLWPDARAAIDKRALEKKQNEKRIESAGYQKELETILEKEKQPQPTPLQNLQQFAQQQQQNKSSRN